MKVTNFRKRGKTLRPGPNDLSPAEQVELNAWLDRYDLETAVIRLLATSVVLGDDDPPLCHCGSEQFYYRDPDGSVETVCPDCIRYEAA